MQLGLLLVAAMLSVGAGVGSPTQAAGIGYEAFIEKPVPERRALFGAMSAQERYAIMKTHLDTCLDVLRAQLTSEQQKAVQDSISELSPALYETPASEKTEATMKLIQQRAHTMFQGGQGRMIFTLDDGRCRKN